MILYQKGDPDGFIKVYEPLLSQRCTVPGRLLTLRAYLSNAYLAKGDFERAVQLLDEGPEVTGREAENAKDLLAGNRCTIALRSGDTQEAGRQFRLLSEARERGRADDKLFADLPLLRELLAVREGRPCDTAAIRTASEKRFRPSGGRTCFWSCEWPSRRRERGRRPCSSCVGPSEEIPPSGAYGRQRKCWRSWKQIQVKKQIVFELN